MWDDSSNQFLAIDEGDVPALIREGRVIFRQGEHVELKGLEFVVFNVTEVNLILRPVKKVKAA